MSPETKATELVNTYCISSPSELKLEEIANAENLIVEEEKLKSHLGRITYGDDYGLIKISTTLESIGAKRFTLAHEMGHYFLERNLVNGKHNCMIDDLYSFKTTKKHEDDANQFAAELLMHKPWFSDFISKREINMDLIKETAYYFNVSLTAAAIRYAEIGKYPIAVILSKDAKVQWSYFNEYFPLKFIPKGYFVRKESIAYDYFNGEEVQTVYDMVPAHTWFSEDFKCPRDMYLYEQSLVMRNYKSVLTLLWESG